MAAPITTVDVGLFEDVARWAQESAWAHAGVQVFTSAGIVVLAVMALGLLLRARRAGDLVQVSRLAWLGFGTLLSIGAGLVLKQVFQEVRPCSALHVATVDSCPALTDYSFPSDHTIVAVALALGIWLANRRWGGMALLLALLEGASRIYLGDHYPHDVLAGMAVSAVLVLGGWLLLRRPVEALVLWLHRSRVRALVDARRPRVAAAA